MRPARAPAILRGIRDAIFIAAAVMVWRDWLAGLPTSWLAAAAVALPVLRRIWRAV